MKKLLLIITIVFFMFVMVGCSKKEKKDEKKSDSIIFKEEYEKLNGENSGYGTYTSVEIPKDNKIVYSNIEEIITLLENGTGVIYFGFPECPWCRSMVSTLLNTAEMVGIEKIYYFNAKSIRDEKELDKDGNIVIKKEGTEEYYDLLKVLDEVASSYEGLNDESIKRLYFPTVVFVKEGSIIGFHEGTVESQEDPTNLLTEEQEKELSNIYSTYMHEMLGDVCDKTC